MAWLVEAFVAGEEELADPVERVGLATAVAEGLVLDAAADLVDATVPTLTTWNGSATRVAWSRCGDSPARNDSARSVATTSIPASQAGSALAHHRRRSDALLPSTMSITIRARRSTRPVAYIVGCSRLALRNDVSSTPR